MKDAVQAAYRRLEDSVMVAAGSIGAHDALRAAVKRTLEGMRERIDTDPAWLDDVMRFAQARSTSPDRESLRLDADQTQA